MWDNFGQGKRCVTGKAAQKDWPWLHSIEPAADEAASVSAAVVILQAWGLDTVKQT